MVLLLFDICIPRNEITVFESNSAFWCENSQLLFLFFVFEPFRKKYTISKIESTKTKTFVWKSVHINVYYMRMRLEKYAEILLKSQKKKLYRLVYCQNIGIDAVFYMLNHILSSEWHNLHHLKCKWSISFKILKELWIFWRICSLDVFIVVFIDVWPYWLNGINSESTIVFFLLLWDVNQKHQFLQTRFR